MTFGIKHSFAFVVSLLVLIGTGISSAHAEAESTDQTERNFIDQESNGDLRALLNPELESDSESAARLGPIVNPDFRIVVHPHTQTLDVYERGHRNPIATYPVSTSYVGLGMTPNSNRTPYGNFRVAQMIGDGADFGRIFVAREPQGLYSWSHPRAEDLVLTRIIWLDGADGANANSKGRYVYIHGTNHEEDLGKPASHGCVRMKNADIIDLFDLIRNKWKTTAIEIAREPYPSS